MAQYVLGAAIKGALRLRPAGGGPSTIALDVKASEKLQVDVQQVSDSSRPYVTLFVKEISGVDTAFRLRESNSSCLEVDPSSICRAPHKVRLVVDVSKVTEGQRDGLQIDCQLDLLIKPSIDKKLAAAFAAHKDEIITFDMSLTLCKKGSRGSSVPGPAGLAAVAAGPRQPGNGSSRLPPPAPAAKPGGGRRAAAGHAAAAAAAAAAPPAAERFSFALPPPAPAAKPAADWNTADQPGTSEVLLSGAPLLQGKPLSQLGMSPRSSRDVGPPAAAAQKRSRESDPPATTLAADRKQAAPRDLASHAAGLAMEAQKYNQGCAAAGDAYRTAVACGQRSLGSSDATHLQHAVQQFTAARHAALEQQINGKLLTHTVQQLLEALDSAGSSDSYSDSLEAATCGALSKLYGVLQRGTMDPSSLAVQGLMQQISASLESSLAIADAQGQHARVLAEQAAAAVQEWQTLQAGQATQKAAADAEEQQVQADLACCRANFARLSLDTSVAHSGISLDGAVALQRRQNRTSGWGMAVMEVSWLVFAVACRANPRLADAVPDGLLRDEQAAEAVLAGLPADSPLLQRYRQFCSHKVVTAKTSYYKSNSWVRSLKRSIAKAVTQFDKPAEQELACEEQEIQGGEEHGGAIDDATAAAAGRPSQETQTPPGQDKQDGAGQADERQFSNWEEAMPTPASMGSDAAVLHVAKRNVLALATGGVCSMDALSRITYTDLDPAKLAAHPLVALLPTSMQVYKAHVEAVGKAQRVLLEAARNCTKKGIPWLVHNEAYSKAGKANMANPAHAAKREGAIQKWRDGLKEDADAHAAHYQKAVQKRMDRYHAPASAPARHASYEKHTISSQTLGFRKVTSENKRRLWQDPNFRRRLSDSMRQHWQEDPHAHSRAASRAVVDNLLGMGVNIEADTFKEITGAAFLMVPEDFALGREDDEQQQPFENIWTTSSKHLYNWTVPYKTDEGSPHTAVPDLVLHRLCGGGGGDDGDDKPPAKPERKVVLVVEILSDEDEDEAVLGYPRLRAKLQALFDVHGAAGVRVEVWVMRPLNRTQLAGSMRPVTRLHRFVNMQQVHQYLNQRWLAAVQSAFDDMEGGQQLAEELAQLLEQEDAAA